MNIGITGADGLIGWHVRAYLHAQGRHSVRLATRETFSAKARLVNFVEGLDAVVHLAGMNKGDQGVEEVNRSLAIELTAAFEGAGIAPSVAFSNTIWVDRGDNSSYSRGKRAAADHLRDWAEGAGVSFANLILPHTFGEFGKPFHNSVVSTFCHQLARGESPQVIVDGNLELVHAQDVAARCTRALEARESGNLRVQGIPMKVGRLLERLQDMARGYRSQLVPDLREPIDVRLFNTFRSYLYPEHYPVVLNLHEDKRGALFEAVKTKTGGQVFLSTTKPGITRGNHFHTRKMERFVVLSGDAEIRLRRIFGDEVTVFRVSGDKPCYVDMPTFHTHDITNVGPSELVTLFWANEIFDAKDADTYPEPVIRS